MTELNIVALLPMKAHSERVKGKNFRTLNGKPLFRWILDTLLDLPAITQVVINTDARSVLSDNGLVETDRIRIRDRRSQLCGDFVSMNHILADDIAATPGDVFLMTHTTNPLLSPATIQKAIDQFTYLRSSGESDSLFSVNRFQTRFYRQDGSPVNHDPNHLLRTQDLEPWYEENSNLYLFTRDSFHQTQARIGQHPVMFETPRLESIDIDDEVDWQLAEAVAQYLHPLVGARVAA